MRAALALLAGLLAATAFSVSAAAPAQERESRCRATLLFRGVTYFGFEGSHLGLRTGRVFAVAREPQCDDTPPACPTEQPCDPPPVEYRNVAVRRVVGVRPRVAIARRDVANIIYVARDRCRRALASRQLVRCLRRSR